MPKVVAMTPSHPPEELRRLAARTKDANQSRRLLSIAAALYGMSRADAARIGGMDRQSAARLRHAMVIVERLLFLAAAHGDNPVHIRVYQPIRGPRDWSCAYEIGWPTEPRRGFGYGIDATQSLVLALQAIGTDLYTSDYHRSGKLKWDVPGRGYGFPVPGTIRDLLIGDDAKAF